MGLGFRFACRSRLEKSPRLSRLGACRWCCSDSVVLEGLGIGIRLEGWGFRPSGIRLQRVSSSSKTQVQALPSFRSEDSGVLEICETLVLSNTMTCGLGH